MKTIDSMQHLAQVLDDNRGDSDLPLGTGSQLVEALVDLGRMDKVIARHDDHLGLKERLSDEFLAAPLESLDSPEFEEDIRLVLDQAKPILTLAQRPLSDSDLEDIELDKQSRGEPV